MAEVEMKKEQEENTCLLDLTDDMYVGTFDQEVIDKYICILCYGIVIDPIKCLNCETLICSRCVNHEKIEEQRMKCFKKCGSKSFTPILKKQEKMILYNLKFRCIHDDCCEEIKYNRLYEHLLKKCKVKTYSKIELPQGACEK
jgi:hypothetical protein